jgi:lipopolysaccharide export system protein LptA
MFTFPKPILALTLLLAASFAANAQSANVAFGGLKADTTLPVEVTAENLEVNQADGTATFVGNVLVKQGEMRLSAGKIRVIYDATGKEIDQLVASGKVLIVNATDAAEAAEAVYTISTGQVVMQGGVLMTQGQTAIQGDKLVINLKTGTGRMEGGVKTTFTPGGN